MKKEKIFSKKCLQFEKRFDIIIKPKGHGRLAQLVEHLLDVQRVRDSSSLPSTIFKPHCKAENGFTMRFFFVSSV